MGIPAEDEKEKKTPSLPTYEKFPPLQLENELCGHFPLHHHQQQQQLWILTFLLTAARINWRLLYA